MLKRLQSFHFPVSAFRIFSLEKSFRGKESKVLLHAANPLIGSLALFNFRPPVPQSH
jgi:hypothetical protein